MKWEVFLALAAFLGGARAQPATGELVRDMPDMQSVRALPPLACSQSLVHGGQDGHLLSNDTVLREFRASLDSEQQDLLDRLLRSSDHEPRNFTTFAMREVLKTLVDNLDVQGRQVYTNLTKLWHTVDFPSVLQAMAWPTITHLVLKPQVMCRLIGDLNTTALDVYCKRILEDDVTTDTAISLLDRCADCLALAWMNRDDPNSENLIQGGKAREVMAKGRQWHASDWDIPSLMVAPEGLQEADVSRISAASFTNRTQLARLNSTIFLEKAPKAVLKRLARRIHQIRGDLSTWPGDLKTMLAFYIAMLPPRVLNAQLTEQEIIDGLTNFDGLEKFMDPRFFKLAGWKIAKYLVQNKNSVSSADKAKVFALLMKHAPYDKVIEEVYTNSDLDTAVQAVKDMGINPKNMRSSVRKLITQGGWIWSRSNVEKLGPLMAAVSPSVIENVPALILRMAWPAIKDADFPVQTLRVLLRKMKSLYSLSTFSCNDMKDMGRLFLVLKSSDIQSLNSRELLTCLPFIGRQIGAACDSNPALCRRVWSTLKTYARATGTDLREILDKVGQNFMTFVPRDDFSDLDVSVPQQLASMDVDENNAPIVFRKVKEKRGQVSKSNLNYTSGDLVKMGKVFFLGASDQDFENLPEDSGFLDLVANMTAYMGQLNAKKLEHVYSKVKRVLGLDSASQACLDEAVTQSVAPLFTQASPDDLQILSNNTRRQIFSVLGKSKSYIARLTRESMRNLTSQVLASEGITSIGEAQINKFGPYVFCGLDASQVDLLTSNALDTYLADLDQCPQLDPDTRKNISKAIMNRAPGNTNLFEDPSRLESMGSMVMEIVDELDSMNAAQKETLVAGMRPIMERAAERMSEVKGRSSNEVSDSEKTAEAAKVSRLASKMLDIRLELQSQSQTSTAPTTSSIFAGITRPGILPGRGKRQVQSGDIKCEMLQDLGGQLSFMTSNQIGSVPSTDFKDCIGEFQNVEWDSSSQGPALRQKLKESYGSDTSTWDSESTVNAGKLLDTLSTSEIENLQNVDSDSLASLGQHNFSSDKGWAIMSTYMRKQSISDVSQLSSDVLTGARKLACSIPASSMRSLNSNAVNTASAKLGEVDCMSDTQLSALGDKLVAATGNDWKDVTSDKISSLGVLAAGLPTQVLSGLSSEQRGRIDSRAITSMDATKFGQVFTADKLSELSRDQANSIRSDQRSQLDATALAILQSIATTDMTVAQLQALLRHITGVLLKDSAAFQEASNLASVACSASLGQAGQSDVMLDDSVTVSTFQSSLDTDQRALFAQIRASSDHNVSIFTTYEMREVLDAMLKYMDGPSIALYLDIRHSLHNVSFEDVVKALTEWPPSIHLLMKREAQCEVLGQLNVTALSSHCLRIVEDDVSTATFQAFVERCAYCIALAFEYRHDPTLINLLHGGKAKVFFKKMRQFRASGWDLNLLSIAPEGLTPADIGRVAATHFSNETQMARMNISQFLLRAPKEVTQRLAERMRDTFGSLDRWSGDRKLQYASIIANLPPSILNSELTAEEMMLGLTEIPDLENMVGEEFFSMAAWKIAKQLIANKNSFTADQRKKVFGILMKYAPSDALVNSVYTVDDLWDAAKDLHATDIDPRNARKAVELLVQSPSWVWNQTTVQLLGPLLTAVPASILEGVDAQLIVQSWAFISNYNFPMETLRMFWRNGASYFDLPRLTCSSLRDMGRMFLVLSTDEVNSIPAATLTECLPHMGQLITESCKQNPRLCSKIWSTVKGYAASNNMNVSEVLHAVGSDFLQYVPRSDMEALNLDDLGQLASLDMDQDNAAVLFRKVKAKYGELSKTNANYTSGELLQMGKVFFLGASSSDLENLPEDSGLMDVAANMSQFREQLPDKTVEVMYKKIKTMIGLDDSTASSVCVDEGIAKQIAPFFTKASSSDLRRLTNESRKEVFKTIGHNISNVQTLTRDKMRNLTQTMMELESLTTVSAEHFDTYGAFMFCGMNSSHVSRLASDVVDRFLSELDQCPQLDSDTRRSLAEKALSTPSGGVSLLDDPARLQSMGSMALELVDRLDSASTYQKNNFATVAKKVMEKSRERITDMKSRSSFEISDTEKAEEERKVQEMAKKVFSIKKASNQAAPLDCSTVESLDGQLDFLGNSDISSMARSDFRDCLSQFQRAAWNSSQLEAFRPKLLQTFGNNTRTWKKEDVLDSGRLLDSLNSSEIADLTTVDADVLTTLGQFNITKAPAVVSSFMSSQGVSDLATVGEDVLRGARNLMCGFSSSQLSSIPASRVDSISSNLGSTSCLDSQQLSTLGDKLVQARGNDWSNVREEDVASLGALAAGLSSDVLNTMNSDQMSRLSEKAISKMPTDTFKKVFTAAKIRNMTGGQMNAISKDQVQALGTNALYAVSDVATFNVTAMLAGAPGQMVGDVGDFQNVARLSKVRCASTMGFAGQASQMLDTAARRRAFRQTLDSDWAALFDTLANSSYHNVSIFTTFEMRDILHTMMTELDAQGRYTFINLYELWDTVSDEDKQNAIENWPPATHLIFKPSIMCELFGRLSRPVLSIYCLRLTQDDVSTATFMEATDRCGYCLALAFEARTDRLYTNMLKGGKAEAFYKKMRQFKSSGWDLDLLTLGPEGLVIEDIDRVDASYFLNGTQMGRLNTTEFLLEAPKEVTQRLAERMRDSFGTLDRWSGDRKLQYASIIANLPPSILNSELTADEMMVGLTEIPDLENMVGEEFFSMAAWKIAKQLIANKNSFTADQRKKVFGMLMKYAPSDALVNSVYTVDDLWDAVRDLNASDIDPRNARKAVELLVQSPSWVWNQTTVQLLGPMLTAVPASILEGVDAQLIVQSWAFISNYNFPMETLRMFWRNGASYFDLPRLTCSSLRDMGRMFLVLSTDEVNSIPAATLTECLPHMGQLITESCKQNPRLCSKIWSTVKGYAASNNMNVSEVLHAVGSDFLQYVPRSDMEALNLDDLGQLASLDMDQDNAAVLFRKVKAKYGELSKTNANYTSGELLQMGKVFFLGASTSDLENLPEDSGLMDVAANMSQFLQQLPDKKVEVMFRKIKTVIGLDDSSTPSICVDGATARQIAPFFTKASTSDLSRLTSDSRKEVFKSIGHNISNVQALTRDKMRNLTQSMMELESLTTVNARHFDEYGAFMFCGMNSSHVSRLASDVVDRFLSELDQCPQLDSDTRRSLAEKALSTPSGGVSLLDDPARLQSMGSMALELVNRLDSASTTQKDNFVQAAKKIMEKSRERITDMKSRSSFEISDTEKAEEERKVQEVAQKVFTIKKASNQAAPLDCSTVESLDGQLDFLGSSDISSMARSEFRDCLSQFQRAAWNSSQLEAFRPKLLQTFGNNTRTWKKEDVLDSGRLLDSLNSSEIADLTTVDADVLTTLGQFNITKAPAVVSSFMSSQGMSDLSTVGEDVLRGARNLMCGFSSSQLSSIPSSRVDSISSNLGSTSCLDSQQLSTLGDKLVQARGNDWSNVREEDVASLGALAAGLSSDVLNTMSSDQMGRLSQDAINKMPTDTFKKVFTAAKIRNMTGGQVNAISKDQVEALGTTALYAIKDVATFNVTDMLANAPGQMVGDVGDFQSVARLSKVRCASTMGFAGQASQMLDTAARRRAFRQTLDSDWAAVFDSLTNSSNHDVSIFTSFEMRDILHTMMTELDAQGRYTFINLYELWDTVSDEDKQNAIENWPPATHLIFKPSIQCELFGKLSRTVLGLYCTRLTYDDVSTATYMEFVDRCGYCLALANEVRSNVLYTNLLKGGKAEAFYKKMRQFKPNGWDLDLLTLGPEGLVIEDIDRVDISHFLNGTQMARMNVSQFLLEAPKEVAQRLAERMRDTFGTLDRWSGDRKLQYASIIANLPPSILNSELTADEMMVGLTEIPDLENMVGEEFFSMAAWKIAKQLIANKNSFSADQRKKVFGMLMKYAPSDALVNSVYTVNDLWDAVRDLNATDIDPRNARKAVELLVQSPSWVWNQTTVQLLGPLLTAVPASILEGVDAQLIVQSWAFISNYNFPMETLRLFWRNGSSFFDLPRLSCSSLRDMGRMFLVLSTDEVNSIPAATLTECLPHMGQLITESCQQNPRLCSKIWSTVKGYAASNNMNVSEVLHAVGSDFLQYVPRSDMEALNLDDLGQLASLDMDQDNAAVLFRKVKAKYGELSKTNANYTSGELLQMGKVFFLGASSSDLENLPEDSGLMDVAANMSQFLQQLPDKKVEVMFKKIKTVIGLDDSSNPSICLDGATAQQIAPFFIKASSSDLSRLTDTSRKEVFKAIGRNISNIQTLTRDKMRNLTQTMLDLESLTTVNARDFDEYGPFMFCGMNSSHVSRLASDVVDRFLSELDKCPQLDSDTRRSVAEKALSTPSGGLSLLDDPARLQSMGSMALELVDRLDSASTTQKDNFVQAAKKIMEKSRERITDMKSRSSFEISDTEKAEEERKVQEVAQKVFTIKKASNQAAPLDCSTVESLDGQLDFLGSSDISSMARSEFRDCLSQFQRAAWNSSQLEAFRPKLLQAFGNNTRSWRKEDVLDSGRLLDSLNSSEIADLTTVDADVLTTLGQFNITKAPAVVSSFMSSQGMSDLSTVGEDVLRGARNLMCGFSSSQLSSIPSNRVDSISSNLGSTSCLDSQQLSTLGDKLVQARGNDWSNVREEDVASLGALAAGLPSNVLNTLGSEQLGRLSEGAINKMNASTFAEVFTADKIRNMTSNQMNAISNDQVQALGTTALYAVSDVATFNVSDMLAGAPSALVKDVGNFKAVRQLAKVRCASTMGFAGQASQMLDTADRRRAFRQTLDSDWAAVFDAIVNSSYHDVSIFTTFEMRDILYTMMTELDAQGRSTYINLYTLWDTVSYTDKVNALENWPPATHLMFRPSIQCELFGKLNRTALGIYCVRLTMDDVSTATFMEATDRCGDCLALAYEARTDLSMEGMVYGIKAKVLYQKLRQWQQGSWDLNALMLGPEGVTPPDVTRVSADSFTDAAQLQRLNSTYFLERASMAVRRRLAERLHSELGALSSWSGDLKLQLAVYLAALPPRILHTELTTAEIFFALSKLEGIEELVDPKFFKLAGWKIAKYVIRNKNTITAAEKQKVFAILMKYAPHKALIRQVYSSADILSYIENVKDRGIEPENMIDAVVNMVTSSSWTWDASSFRKLGPLIAAVPADVMANVSTSLLASNWDRIKHANFSVDVLRVLWEKGKSYFTLSSMTCSDIKVLGRLLLALSRDEITQIPVAQMSSCVRYVGDLLTQACAENPRVCTTVWTNVKSYVQSNNLNMSDVLSSLGEGFIEYVPRDELEGLSLADFGDLKGLDIADNKAAIVFRKVKLEKGNVSTTNLNYTANELVKMGKVFVFGADNADFENLPEDSSLLDLVANMSQYVHKINGKKLEIVFKKLKRLFALDSSSDVCIDGPLADLVAPFFTQASSDDLNKLSTTTRKNIFKKIGQNVDNIKRLPRATMATLTTSLIDTAGKSTLTEQDVDEYGPYMLCGMTSSQAGMLSGEALDNYVGELDQCSQMDSETRTTVANTVASQTSGGVSLFDDPQKMEKMGSLVTELTTSLDSLTSDQAQTVVSSMRKILKRAGERVTEIQAKVTSDVSDAVKAAEVSKAEQLASKMLDLRLSVSFSSAVTGRRRRSTTTLDCTAVTDMNGQLSILTTTQILSMVTSEYTNCLSQFQSTAWSTDQLGAHATQLKTAYTSDTSVWTKQHVQNSGRLLDGLTSVEILTFGVVDADVLSSLGQHTFAKASDITSSFMGTQGLSDLSTATASMLTGARNLMCGFSASNISTIPASVVNDISSTMSQVGCFSADQLSALGAKLVEYQGSDWSSVQSDAISDLGVLVAGLPTTALEDLSGSQISSISTTAISSMPSTTFATVFTVDKIVSLSSDQANAVTTDQMSQLSSDQLTAVTVVSTTSTSTTSTSNTNDNSADNSQGSEEKGAGHQTAVSWACVLAVILALATQAVQVM